MKQLKRRWWTRLVLGATFPALALISQTGFAQEDAGTESVGLALQSMQTEDAFEKFANLHHLASAWRNLDSAAMTDSALLFAEAERVLLRSHRSVKASDVFDLAIRVATEKGDKISLGRLGKALKQSGDKERVAQVTMAIQAAGASRAVDPVLIEGDVATIQSVQSEIQSARVAGSKTQLAAIGESLADLLITDDQKAALKKEIAEASESTSDADDVPKAVAELDRLSGVVRPLSEIREPEGGKFRKSEFTDELTIAEQTALFENDFALLRNSGDPPPIGVGLVSEELEQLLKPSRASGWTDQKPFDPRPKGKSRDYAYNAYGVGSIFQYTNANTQYRDQNCGQAAVATMLTYHGKYPATNDDSLQIILEKPPFNPEIPITGGTSPGRVIHCCNNFGLNTWSLWGEAEMKKWIKARYPVIVVVDVSKVAGWGTGLHYTVVYAYDANNYWCTNWMGSAKVPKSVFLRSMVSGAFILTMPK